MLPTEPTGHRLKTVLIMSFVFLLCYQVRGDHIVACTASEIADRIAIIQGLEEEQKSSVAERCARIYAECNPKPGKPLLPCISFSSTLEVDNN
jgi:hypothetical protein